AKLAANQAGRAASSFRKCSELRQDAPPLSIPPHKNIRGPLVRSEFVPHEFSFRASKRAHHSAVSIDTDSNVLGLHHFMSESARLDHLKKTLPVDDSSVRVDDDPVIADKLSDLVWIIFHDRIREFLLHLYKFFFHFVSFLWCV